MELENRSTILPDVLRFSRFILIAGGKNVKGVDKVRTVEKNWRKKKDMGGGGIARWPIRIRMM